MSRLVQYAVLSMLALMFTAAFCSPLHTGEHVNLTRRDLNGDIKRWSETVNAIGEPRTLDLPGIVQALWTLERVFMEMEQSPHNKERRIHEYLDKWEGRHRRLVLWLGRRLGVKDEPPDLDEASRSLHDIYINAVMFARASFYIPIWKTILDSGISDPTYDRLVILAKNSMCVINSFTRVEPKRNIHLFRDSPQVVEEVVSVLDSLLPPPFKLNAETECANTPLAKKWVPLSEQGSPQQQPQKPQPQPQESPQGPQPKPQNSQQSQQTQEPQPEKKNQKQTFFQWLGSIRPIKWLLDLVKRFLPSNRDKNNGDSTK